MTRWTRVTHFGPGGEPLETVTGNVVLPAGTTTIGGRPRDIDITVFPYEPRPDGLILGSFARVLYPNMPDSVVEGAPAPLRPGRRRGGHPGGDPRARGLLR